MLLDFVVSVPSVAYCWFQKKVFFTYEMVKLEKVDLEAEETEQNLNLEAFRFTGMKHLSLLTQRRVLITYWEEEVSRYRTFDGRSEATARRRRRKREEAS